MNTCPYFIGTFIMELPMFMFILASIYILFALDIYTVEVISMHRLFIHYKGIDRLFVYVHI